MKKRREIDYLLDEDELEDEEEKVRKVKEPSEPIPEDRYKQFKYRIVEMSKEFPERNLMLFLLGIATGYRTDDIVDLTIGEIKEALEEEFFIIQEKKQYRRWKNKKDNDPEYDKKIPKKRKVAIKSKLRKLLKEYIKDKNKSECAFKSKKGRYISAKSFSEFLTKVGEDLGLEHISGHSMRKTYATRLWEEKHDMNYVRKALGHKSIETTQLYLGYGNKDIEDAAEITDSKL